MSTSEQEDQVRLKVNADPSPSDEGPLLSPAANYDPDQERDDYGRWTSEGGGGTGHGFTGDAPPAGSRISGGEADRMQKALVAKGGGAGPTAGGSSQSLPTKVSEMYLDSVKSAMESMRLEKKVQGVRGVVRGSVTTALDGRIEGRLEKGRDVEAFIRRLKAAGFTVTVEEPVRREHIILGQKMFYAQCRPSRTSA